MEHTEYYHLPQWEADDRIHHDDFNDAFSKLDTAVKANSTALAGKASAADLTALQNDVTGLVTAVAQCGNCEIVFGTYTGSGQNGSDAPNSLSFTKKPQLIIIMPQTDSEKSYKNIVLINGCTASHSYGSLESLLSVTWSGNSVSWYGSAAWFQFNEARPYCYVALLADE